MRRLVSPWFAFRTKEEKIEEPNTYYSSLTKSKLNLAFLINPSSNIERGWRKTLKWTNKKGIKVAITTGKGPIFEDSDNESESCVKSLDNDVNIVLGEYSSKTPTRESLYNVLVLDFI